MRSGTLQLGSAFALVLVVVLTAAGSGSQSTSTVAIVFSLWAVVQVIRETRNEIMEQLLDMEQLMKRDFAQEVKPGND